METLTVLVVGDTHANFNWLVNSVLPYAQRVGASKIMQVGDFGFVWSRSNYLRVLDRLSRALDHAGIDLHFLPGNHEDYPRLELLSSRQRGVSPEGHVSLRPRVFYTGKVSSWTWNGRRCVAVGGATSIDRLLRVPGESWWPEEALTASEAETAKGFRRADVLFSHDCPVQHPFRLIPDADSQAHRVRITDVARTLCPQVWFHGHYHRYAKYSFMHERGDCEVTGLDCDGSEVLFGTSVLRLPPPRQSSI